MKLYRWIDMQRRKKKKKVRRERIIFSPGAKPDWDPHHRSTLASFLTSTTLRLHFDCTFYLELGSP